METIRPCLDCCRWRRDRPTKSLQTHPAPLSVALCHPPPYSIVSGLQLQLAPLCRLLCNQAMTSAHRHTASRRTREGGHSRVLTRLLGGTIKIFHAIVNRQAALRPVSSLLGCLCLLCTSAPAPDLVSFCSESQTRPRTTEDRRPSRPGLLFVMSAAQHTFRAIDMYFDLAVHSS